MSISDLSAYEILDSRGNPTIYCELFFGDDMVSSSVPSGASTGAKEALELRDGVQNRYNGKGVKRAVTNINDTIKKELIGKELNQKEIDELLIKLDGTDNKSNLGANATLAVSMCVCKAIAKQNKK